MTSDLGSTCACCGAHHSEPPMDYTAEAPAVWEHGQAPSVQEVGEGVGLRSRSSVHHQLVELEAKHAIRRERGRSRGIRLT
ncbi:hypothetical protein ACGFT2_06590 [Streptomyces sp. NPDC048514]|uniref:LexA family protein n=1 Tax=Streptomyces sp. NPDC048514 TaxID=3365564 RepID=UPI00371D2833